MQRLQELYNAIQNDFQTYGARLPEAERQRITNEIKRLELIAAKQKLFLFPQEQETSSSIIAELSNVLQADTSTEWRTISLYGEIREVYIYEQETGKEIYSEIFADKTKFPYYINSVKLTASRKYVLAAVRDKKMPSATTNHLLSFHEGTEYMVIHIEQKLFGSFEQFSDALRNETNELIGLIREHLIEWNGAATKTLEAAKKWYIKNVNKYFKELIDKPSMSPEEDIFRKFFGSTVSATTMKIIEGGAHSIADKVKNDGIVGAIIAGGLRKIVSFTFVGILVDVAMNIVVDYVLPDTEANNEEKLKIRLAALNTTVEESIEKSFQEEQNSLIKMNKMNHAFLDSPEAYSTEKLFAVYKDFLNGTPKLKDSIGKFVGDESLYENLKKLNGQNGSANEAALNAFFCEVDKIRTTLEITEDDYDYEHEFENPVLLPTKPEPMIVKNHYLFIEKLEKWFSQIGYTKSITSKFDNMRAIISNIIAKDGAGNLYYAIKDGLTQEFSFEVNVNFGTTNWTNFFEELTKNYKGINPNPAKWGAKIKYTFRVSPTNKGIDILNGLVTWSYETFDDPIAVEKRKNAPPISSEEQAQYLFTTKYPEPIRGDGSIILK